MPRYSISIWNFKTNFDDVQKRLGKQLPPEPPLADWDSPPMGNQVEEQEIVSVCALPDQACVLGEGFLIGHVEVYELF